MPSLPEAVSRTLQVLKREYGAYLQVKIIKGRFCLFEEWSTYDRATGMPRKSSKYLGRITEEGVLIPARHRKEKQVRPAQYITQKELQEMQKQAGKQEISEKERIILRYLSMNARASLGDIGKAAGLSTSAIGYNIRKLEKAYGIRYFAEIDVEKLGYVDYIALVKFRDRYPTTEEIRTATETEPRIQLAMLTKGDYDLVLYFLAKSGRETRSDVYDLRERLLSKYNSDWCITPFYMSYGNIPIKDAFFDILRKDVWVKTKEQRIKPEGRLTGREFDVLRDLNANGITEFSSIDAKHGLDKGATQYTFYRLKERGIISRITISMQNLQIKYNAIILAENTNPKLWESDRKKLLSYIIEEGCAPINKYAALGDTIAPNSGVLIIVPVLNDDDLEKETIELSRIHGLEARSLVATQIITGTVCYRLFDREHSNQFKLLVDIYGLKSDKEKTNYDL